MWTKVFWKDALERALKTFAQAILTIITLAGISIMSDPLHAIQQLTEIGWIALLFAGLVAFIWSILTSIVSSVMGAKGTASLINK